MTTTTNPRGPYRTGVRRKAQIVDAAWAIFARRGYATASLREIADAVGVTTAALLRHFDSKEDLLIAVLDRWDQGTHDLGIRTSMGQALDYFLTFPALMRYHVEHPGLIELFLTLCTEASDPEHPARDWVAARYASIVRDGVHQLQEAGRAGLTRPMPAQNAETEVRALYAMMDGLELQWMADGTLDLVSEFERSFSITLQRWGVDEEIWRTVDDGTRSILPPLER
ncbi:TetR/AcrR family transcriptional regulator [Microbacteriaceae bacterium VKM Ac-2855]|nr:TetR/AcrR family transcriptional regulator [Microbacteriaceae bacterium VKM Ac-2855]